MRSLGCVLLLLGAILAPPLAAEEIPSRDFAYGYMIEVEEAGAIYSLALPESVYRTVRRADLGDVRVYNGAGERVPHALRTIETPEATSRKAREAVLFPLHGDATDGRESLSLSVRREADGTLIAIDAGNSSRSEAQPVSGYIVDLGEDDADISTLEVFWQSANGHGEITLAVRQSSDLQHWHDAVGRTTLVDLEYGGNRVEQRRIELSRRTSRYLRFTWLRGQEVPVLERVVAWSRPVASRVRRQYLPLYNGVKTSDQGNLVLSFSSNYRLPVSSINLQFAEPNSMVSGIIQSRSDDQDRWRTRCQQVFYAIEVKGTRLASEPCTFNPTSDSQWRLVVSDDGAGLASSYSSLVLSLGWQSDELLFMARGTGPFLLAYGSGRLEAAKESGHSEMVLTAVGEQADGLVKPARLGKRIELGGEAALAPPVPPTPWKRWLLWSILVAGVLTMAAMARSLVKDMGAGGGKGQGGA